MAVYTTITEKVQYTDVDSHLSNCIGGGEDYRTLNRNTKNIYGGILAIRGWYGSDISQLSIITSISVHLEGVCENTNFKCDCDFTTSMLTSDDVLAGKTPFTPCIDAALGTFSKTFKSGSWQGVDNTIANPTLHGQILIANTCFIGVKLVFWNGNLLTNVKCKIRNVTISLTRTRACYIVFKGEGITFSRNEYEYGTIPSYGSIPARDGYTFKGWNNGTTTYSGTLPAANDYDTEYTAVWEKNKYTLTVDAGTGGTVSGGGTYEHGTSVTITATPNSGYKFFKWSDGYPNATRTITVTDNKSLTAIFEEIIVPPEIVSAAITYGGAQVSAQNKVPAGEGYLIAVGLK